MHLIITGKCGYIKLVVSAMLNVYRQVAELVVYNQHVRNG
jgi:hypothetical protein